MHKLTLFNKRYFSISVISFEIEMENCWETNSTLNTWAVGYIGEMYRVVVTGFSHADKRFTWQFCGSHSDCHRENKDFEIRSEGYIYKYYGIKSMSTFNLKRELTLEDDEAVIYVVAIYNGEIKKLSVTIAVKRSFYYF